MWIVKGILLGVVIFVVGGISYTLIGVGIGMYRLAQAVKAGAVTQTQGGNWDARALYMSLSFGSHYWPRL